MRGRGLLGLGTFGMPAGGSPPRPGPARRSIAPLAIALALVIGAVALGAPAARAEIGIALGFTPDVIATTQSSTLSITITNTDAEPALAATGTLTLPAGVAIAPLPNLQNTCGGAVEVTPGGGSIGLVDGVIPPATAAGAGACVVAVDVVSDTPSTYLHSIGPGGLLTSRGANPVAAEATLAVEAGPPIVGTISFAPATIHAHTQDETHGTTVTITLRNHRTMALTGVSFVNTLPDELNLARNPNPPPATTCGGSLNNPQPLAQSIELTGGAIPAGGSCTVTFKVRVKNPQLVINELVTNKIPIGTITTAQGVSNATIAGEVLVQGGARVVKSFEPASVASGAAPTLRLEFRNYNANQLTSISLTDNLPSPMRVANPPNGAHTCLSGSIQAVAGNANFSFTNGAAGPAPAGPGYTSCSMSVSVTAVNSGPSPVQLTNTIDDNTFGGVNAVGSSATLTVDPANLVAVAKAFTGAAVQGGVVTLAIVVDTDAATPAGNVTLTDDLATMGPGYTVAASPPPASTCGGTLSAAAGSTVVTLSNGSVPAGGTCTLIVPVQIAGTAEPGTRTNTIPAGAVQTSVGNNISPASASVQTVQALSVAKAFTPGAVVAGQDSRLTITLTTVAGAPALTGVAFTDSLPAGHAVSASPAAASTCGGAVTANPGAATVSLSGGALGAGPATCAVQVKVTTPAGKGSATNTLAANAVSTAQGVTNGSAASATLVRIETAVSIAKAFTPPSLSIGQATTMTLTIANTGPDALALTGGTLADLLPAGLAVADPPNASFTGAGCAGTVTAAAGAGIVVLTGASIGVGSTCALAADVTAASGPGEFTNTVAAGAFRSAEGVTNAAPASATVAVSGTADLAVAIVPESGSPVPGGTLTYRMTVSNLGPDDAAGAVFTASAPAGTTFSQWSCAPSANAACTGLGAGDVLDTVTIPSGGSLEYFVTMQLGSSLSGVIVTIASIAPPAEVLDPDLGNNEDQAALALAPATLLDVFKSDGIDTYTPGAQQTYAIVVRNLGPSNAADVGVADTLPAGVTLTASPTCTAGGNAACGAMSGTAGGGTVAMTGGQIAAGAANSLTILVPVAYAAGLAVESLVNTAAATDAPSGGTGVNSDTDTRLAVVGLALDVDDPSATYTPGGTGTVTVTVTNPAGISDALDVSVGDLLPAGVTLTGPVTCAATGTATCGPVTGASGGASFGMTGAILGAGAGNSLALILPVAFAPGLTASPLVITATATDAASGSTASDSDSATPLPVAALSVTKTDGSDVYSPGGHATYVIVVQNAGPSDALAVSVTDTLPAGVTLTGPVQCTATGNATCGSVTGEIGGGAFGATGARVGAGGSLTFQLPVAFALDVESDPLVNMATVTDATSGATASASDSNRRGVLAVPVLSPAALAALIAMFPLIAAARARHRRRRPRSGPPAV